ncbi:hypothetical protein RHSIM_Rhsim08G0146800 [Rhododendron simsii]|uniref:Transmembrane protein n=1 Tax=Rhododendron simsii TaxID=118357 RepID=A0A834GP53_RHOSS|nr:hypothetical protein RHSIM_Rhsim08G0146800 [Rhododendron simsii]
MTTTQRHQQQGLEITRSLSPTSISHSKIDLSLSSSECHGFWRDAALAVSAALFVLYLAFHAKKNLRKLSNGRNYVTIAYYTLLWLAALLNLAWCSLQAWQCSSGKEVAWNLLSLFTTAGTLCLEISLMAFLIQENHSTGFEMLARAFTLSGFIVGVDILVKAAVLRTCSILKELSQLLVAWLGMFWQLFRGNICIWIQGLFIDSEETTHKMKWGLWTVSKILLAAVYGFILFVHSSKWQDKLPSRPMFYNYVVAMFVTNAVALFACALAGIGLTFGPWYVYIRGISLVVQFDAFLLSLSLSSVSVYNLLRRYFSGDRSLPFVILVEFIVPHFNFLQLGIGHDLRDCDVMVLQEEDLRLDNAYYSEMKDAGFFDVDWE